MYSKSRHGRDWSGVDINSALSAQQSAGRDAQTAARPTAARYVNIFIDIHVPMMHIYTYENDT